MELEQWSQISKSIRFKIDLFDGKFDDDVGVGMPVVDSWPGAMKLGGSFKSGHIFLGAVQKRCLLKEITAAHADDPAFLRFWYKFSQFIQENFSYKSEFSNEDMDMIFGPNAIVCIQTLINSSYLNSKYHIIPRYLNIATLKSLSHLRSLGRLKPISYAAIQISTTSPDMTTSLLLHQKVLHSLGSYLCLRLRPKTESIRGC